MVVLNIIILITLIGLFIASLNDIKAREVPDWLNFSLIVIGLGLRLLYSAITFDFSFFIYGVVGFGVFFILSLLLFYTGQWGGGDSKLLMAMGALLGLQFKVDSMIISFFINLFLVGAIYGFVWSLFVAIKNWKKFVQEYRNLSSEKSARYMKITMLVVFLMLLVFVIIVNSTMFKVMFFAFAILIYGFFYLWLFVKSVESACMVKYLPTTKLTEGDWIVKDVKVKGKYICGPKDLGIERKQIELLKKYNIKKVLVKEGIPFVPSFFLGFIVTLLAGNWWIGLF